MEGKTEPHFDETEKEKSTEEDKEPVRTLFVSGFPPDVKQREISNLFRFQSGFQYAVLNQKKGPVAFVQFDSQANALKAKETFSGLKFDPDLRAELRIELARSNSYIASRKRGLSGDGTSSTSATSIITLRAPTGSYDKRSRDTSSSSRSMGGVCTTLFVANLAPSTTEDEVRQMFASQAGFRQIRFNRTKVGPVAFADFSDESYSSLALQNLQGQTLTSGDGRAMRVEYAKSAMNSKPSTKGSASPEYGGGFGSYGSAPARGPPPSYTHQYSQGSTSQYPAYGAYGSSGGLSYAQQTPYQFSRVGSYGPSGGRPYGEHGFR